MENEPVSLFLEENPESWFPSDSFLLIQQNEANSTCFWEPKPGTIVPIVRELIGSTNSYVTCTNSFECLECGALT